MRRLGAVLAAVLGLAIVLPPAAATQPTNPDAARLRLASKTPWVAPGGELVLRVMAEADEPSDVELAVSVHGRITSRSEFARSLVTPPRGTPLTVVSGPLGQLGPDPAGALTVRLPIQDPAAPRDPARLFLSRDGVYPVRVELRELGGGDLLAGFTTHLVNAGNPVDPVPLAAAVVLPFHADPTTQPDLSRATPPLDVLRQMASSLASNRSSPVTVEVTPETVESLAQAGPEGLEVLADLRTGLAGRQVTGTTYVAVAADSLLSSGLAGELTAQRARGANVLGDLLDVRPDPRVWVVRGGIDSRVLAEARSAQVDRLVVREEALEPADLNLTLAQPFSIESRRGDFPSMAIDPGLSDHFDLEDDDAGGPVLAAHHLLADLAVIHYDSPAARRAVVVSPPFGWKPSRSFLDTFLGGLDQSPIVRAAFLDEAFDTPPASGARRGTDLVREPAESKPRSLPTKAIEAARAELESFAGLVDRGNRMADAFERALLSSQSSGLPPARRKGLIDAVGSGIEEQFSKISLPGNRSVTLTARTGEIPVTIQSGLDYPVRARLRVESDKLGFPEGSRRELELANTNTTERFTVRARTSGAFPLRVVLESPDGDLVLARSLFTVRSTAASGVGVALSAGAGGFLALWWARHVMQARRQRRQAAAEAG